MVSRAALLCAATLVLLAGSATAQFQLSGVGSLVNAGQLNQAAVQQLAQAAGGAAANGAAVTQINGTTSVVLHTLPTCCAIQLTMLAMKCASVKVAAVSHQRPA